MDFERAMKQRYSCRAFLPEEVEPCVIEEMFAVAQLTASWCNTQPWHVHLTSGIETRKFGDALTEHVVAHPPSPDLPMPETYSGVYLERRRRAGFGMYQSLDIARGDYAAREQQMLRNYAFFGAPHAAIITSDREQGAYGAIDCGAFVANFLNAATAHGVATVPQAAIATHSAFVRAYLNIPDDRLVICAVSFGYADPASPVNAFRTDRAAVHDVLQRFISGPSESSAERPSAPR